MERDSPPPRMGYEVDVCGDALRYPVTDTGPVYDLTNSLGKYRNTRVEQRHRHTRVSL